MRKMLALLLLMGCCAGVQAAGDAEAGKGKTGTCVACHGADGVSVNPLWPNLAGQQEQYLVAQMKAFRDGVRENAQMGPMSKNLSDQDIEDLAAYYSGLPCAGN